MSGISAPLRPSPVSLSLKKGTIAKTLLTDRHRINRIDPETTTSLASVIWELHTFLTTLWPVQELHAQSELKCPSGMFPSLPIKNTHPSVSTLSRGENGNRRQQVKNVSWPPREFWTGSRVTCGNSLPQWSLVMKGNKPPSGSRSKDIQWRC